MKYCHLLGKDKLQVLEELRRRYIKLLFRISMDLWIKE